MLKMRGRRESISDKENKSSLISMTRDMSLPLNDIGDLDPLLDRIGDARYVLLGEASHGTSEYYVWRARISQRLIQEKGFSFIAVEGDWPDCYSVNRYVKHYPESADNAYDLLKVFKRWPTWMWANWEIVGLTEWLRTHNEDLPEDRRVGFYGLDVYSLWDSIREIIGYLQRVNPDALPAAMRAIKCFEPYGEEGPEYAMATALVPKTCEAEVIALLHKVCVTIGEHPDDRESAFSAEQNALVAVDSEHYYRTMIRSDASSWNIRDWHMADTLDRLMRFHGPESKGIVWQHNTHIGDARATDMAEMGEVNVGQLVREKHAGAGVVLVGFSGYCGSVIAGSEWGAPLESMPVPPGKQGSWEDILHTASVDNKLLILNKAAGINEFRERRGHRAIGVVYNPKYEAYGNYAPTVLPDRYDVLLYFDQTEALHPLFPTAGEEKVAPETYPWGL